MKNHLLMTLILLIAVTPSKVGATVCTPTNFFRDGINLTAALVNPASAVSGTVDATGCNIGVYFDQDGSINGANVYGANYFGVVVNGNVNSPSVDVKNSQIHNIGEVPFNGTQHGVAVYYCALGDGTATGNVTGNTISLYQKGGITVNGAGATVGVTGNTVTGLGPIDFIAQNGIQFGYGANGTVQGNTITGNFYTGDVGVGPNAGGQNPEGWEYTSGGLLLYQAGNVQRSMNFFSGNQRNVELVP